MNVYSRKFKNFEESVPALLREAGVGERLKDKKRLVLKPNLTTSLKPPCTTPVELVEEVVKFCQDNASAKIVVAEGSGGCDTKEAFEKLGYQDLAKNYKIKLVDLNRASRRKLTNSEALALKEVRLPEIVLDSFFINLPVLKEHNAAVITCAMKNLFGLYLNEKEESSSGWWNKSELHSYGVAKSIIDLSHYIKSDFVLVDASVGQKGSEIHGDPCRPPIGKLIAGYSARQVDRFCAPLLGHKPKEIPWLS